MTETLRSRARRWLRMLAPGPVARRRLLRAGLALLGIVGVLIVPGYLATRPGFIGNSAGMEGTLDTLSVSGHANVSCQGCHVRPGLVSQGRWTARMLGEYYLSAVTNGRTIDTLERPGNDACGGCHMDLRTVSPSGDLMIPHRAHVDVLEMECVTCHEYLVHEERPEGGHKPRMVTCMQCHDGVQAQESCHTCHTEKGIPETHKAADWLVTHPSQGDADTCDPCHAWRDDWCADCHSRRPASHVERWRSLHGETVLADKSGRNCEACHDDEFCIRCHGEVPAVNFDSALTRVE